MDSTEGVNFVDTIEFLDDDEADMEFINDVNEHLFSNDQGYLWEAYFHSFSLI